MRSARQSQSTSGEEGGDDDEEIAMISSSRHAKQKRNRSAFQLEWTTWTVIVCLVLLTIVVIVMSVTHMIAYHQVKSTFLDIKVELEKNRVAERTYRFMDFMEQMVPNPLGFLIGDDMTPEAKQKYKVMVDKLRKMVDAIDSHHLVEETAQTEHTFNTMMERVSAMFFPIPSSQSPPQQDTKALPAP